MKNTEKNLEEILNEVVTSLDNVTKLLEETISKECDCDCCEEIIKTTKENTIGETFILSLLENKVITDNKDTLIDDTIKALEECSVLNAIEDAIYSEKSTDDLQEAWCFITSELSESILEVNPDKLRKIK